MALEKIQPDAEDASCSITFIPERAINAEYAASKLMS